MRILASATTALRRIVDFGLIVLIVIVLFGVVLGRGAPLVGRQSIVIGGGSMEPTIGLGAAIVVKPVDPATLAVGDIVSMQVGPERTTYTHRIVAVVDRADGRWIRTKGDANAEPDPTLVPATAVIGRVEVAIPFAGYLLALLSLPMGVMFVLGLAATLLAIAWLLESIEPEPRPARRRGDLSGDPQPHAGASAAATALRSALDPELRSGEPIAARPAVAFATDVLGGGSLGGSSLGGGSRGAGAGAASASLSFAAPILASASASALSIAPVSDAPVARPTVRAQLDRSREIRRQHARWLGGGHGDRGTAN
jgi:signal peptidase I